MLGHTWNVNVLLEILQNSRIFTIIFHSRFPKIVSNFMVIRKITLVDPSEHFSQIFFFLSSHTTQHRTHLTVPEDDINSKSFGSAGKNETA